MYPELYQKWFKLTLNPTEMVLIEILMKVVGLLSKATLGHLANNLPLPILALEDQQSVIQPITCLLPAYSFVLLGDREFCSKSLAT